MQKVCLTKPQKIPTQWVLGLKMPLSFFGGWVFLALSFLKMFNKQAWTNVPEIKTVTGCCNIMLKACSFIFGTTASQAIKICFPHAAYTVYDFITKRYLNQVMLLLTCNLKEKPVKWSSRNNDWLAKVHFKWCFFGCVKA